MKTGGFGTTGRNGAVAARLADGGAIAEVQRQGDVAVVRDVGLGAWLSGVEPGLLAAARDRAQDQWAAMRRQGIQALVMGHRGYPFGLSQVPDAPWILFVKGQVETLHRTRPVAVVGTRRSSVAGGLAVEGVLDGMPDLDWTLISGMAEGIDAAAHRAALERVCRPSLAWPTASCGPLEPMRPWRNASSRPGGAGCRNTGWGMPPSKYTFPGENRIIAGLAQAVVVVESDLIPEAV